MAGYFGRKMQELANCLYGLKPSILADKAALPLGEATHPNFSAQVLEKSANGASISLDAAARTYLTSKHYHRPVGFTVFSSELSQISGSDLDGRIRQLQNEQAEINLVLEGDGFYCTANCQFGHNGYSLQIRNTRLNQK